MKHKWLRRLLWVLVFIGGATPIFTYWNVAEDNKWGTLFSFVSAFGIIFILIDYFKKKNTEENSKNNILMLIFERYNRQYTDLLNAIDCFIDEVCNLYCVHDRFTYYEKTDRDGLIRIIKEKLANYEEIKITSPLLVSPGFTNSDILQLAAYNKSVASVLLDTEQCIDNIKFEIRELSYITSKENIKSAPPIFIISTIIEIERLRDVLEDRIKCILQKS